MPRYSYRVRKPAPAPEIRVDRTFDRPSVEKATRVSRPSTDKATQGVPRTTTTRKTSDG